MKQEVHRISIKPVDDEGRYALFLDGKRVPYEELEEALERYIRPIEADESEEWAVVWEDIKEYYRIMLKLSAIERFQLLMQMRRFTENL